MLDSLLERLGLPAQGQINMSLAGALAGAGVLVLALLWLAMRARADRLARARDADARTRAEAEIKAELSASQRLIAGELAELKGRFSAIAETSERRQGEAENRTAEALRDVMRTTAERQAELQGIVSQRLELVSDRLWQSLERVGDRVGGNLAEVSGRLGESMSDVGRRTADMLTSLNERLATIDGAQQALVTLSGEVVTLQGVLSDKQARGAYGQARMETIIEDALPKGSYAFQATLSNGSRPDGLVHLGGATARLAIDAKFPLEGFEALRRAGTEVERHAAEAGVRAHIGRHIGDIAGKYLIPGETQDTALMFVPAESVYAELHQRFPDLIQKALRARVVIVSPNMLMLAVETMRAVMKDVRMREEAGLIQREVGLIVADVRRLAERVHELERHFGLAVKDLEKVGVAAARIEARGGRIERLDLAEAPGPLAVPIRQAND